LELDEVMAVLHKVQSFEPPGVGALNLQDCLLIQLKQLPEDSPLAQEAIELVSQHMAALGSQDSAKLKRQLGIDDEKLEQIITLIQGLNPRPGSDIGDASTEYITPDVYVTKVKGRWQISINGEVASNIRINPYYQALIKRGDKSADSQTMKNHLQEARWFLKSLQSRNETLLLVSQEIVNRQQEFLEHGAIAMKPMVLRDIAETVEMHESTISRVTTNKYMHTPNGIYELKHFFSSHVSTDSGGECSATAIRAFIKKLVNNENPKKPLSDNKIAAILSDRGINVARRTIAKYRESISIPPSSQRKRIL
jgi:RNA polymerase sigma-54 factor